MFSRWQPNKIPAVQDVPSPAAAGLPTRSNAPATVPAGPGNYRPQGQQSMNNSGPGGNMRPAPSSRYGSNAGGPGGQGGAGGNRMNGLPGGGGRPSDRMNGPPGGGRPSDRMNGLPGGGGRDSGIDARRNELMRGARERTDAPNQYANNPLNPAYGGLGQSQDNSQQQYDDEDEEVEGIKQQMRETNAKAHASSSNALRVALEAEETGKRTLTKITEQGVRLDNVKHQLDVGDLNASRSEDATKEITALNRSIFRPTFTINKTAKRDAKEQKILERHQSEQAGRESLRQSELDGKARNDATFRQLDAGKGGGGGGGLRSRLAEKSRFQFENTAEDDAMEDQIEDNIDQLAEAATRLNLLGQSMGTELKRQNQQLGSIADQTDKLDSRIYAQTERLKRIK